MGKVYFVCSDIHGFFTEWMVALEEAGFQRENPEHILLVLGDVFDRGEEAVKVFWFLKNLPKERKILVRGNHESLLIELYLKGWPSSYDVSNGTLDTLKQIAKESKEGPIDFNDFFENQLIDFVIDWLQGEEWIDFYETPHYIFVHAFIPLLEEEGELVYNPDWRNASFKSWEAARWRCPWEDYALGCFKPEEEKGKTLVCGHWHTSDFYNHLDYAGQPEKKLDIKTDNPIYRSKKFPGLIGLDACTALTRKVNVLALKEEEL